MLSDELVVGCVGSIESFHVFGLSCVHLIHSLTEISELNLSLGYICYEEQISYLYRCRKEVGVVVQSDLSLFMKLFIQK